MPHKHTKKGKGTIVIRRRREGFELKSHPPNIFRTVSGTNFPPCKKKKTILFKNQNVIIIHFPVKRENTVVFDSSLYSVLLLLSLLKYSRAMVFFSRRMLIASNRYI